MISHAQGPPPGGAGEPPEAVAPAGSPQDAGAPDDDFFSEIQDVQRSMVDGIITSW